MSLTMTDANWRVEYEEYLRDSFEDMQFTRDAQHRAFLEDEARAEAVSDEGDEGDAPTHPTTVTADEGDEGDAPTHPAVITDTATDTPFSESERVGSSPSSPAPPPTAEQEEEWREDLRDRAEKLNIDPTMPTEVDRDITGTVEDNGKFYFNCVKLGQHLKARASIRLGADRELWRYHPRGLFTPDGKDWAGKAALTLLGDDFRAARLNETQTWLRTDMPTPLAEPNPDFINLANGLLEWRTGVLFPHTPDARSVVQLPLAWEPRATCPNIARRLLEITGDPAKVDLLYEFFGYALWTEQPYKRAAMLVGPGDNGKSVIAYLLVSLLGRKNTTTRTLHDLTISRFTVASVLGKLANVCADLDHAPLETSDKFKQLTGGDLMTGEKKYGDQFDFKPFATLMFCANEPPASRDHTPAYLSRWLPFYLPHRFRGPVEAPAVCPCGDTHPFVPQEVLMPELTTPDELAGLLVQAVHGLRRLEARGGFARPEALSGDTEQFQEASNPIFAFVRDCCELRLDGSTDRAVMYNAYKVWASENGHRFEASRNFNRNLQTNFPTLGLPTRVGRPTWVGIRLLNDFTAASTADPGASA